MRQKTSAARCPCCKGRVEYYPDQDGSCDWECPNCGWHQHVPARRQVARQGKKP